MSNQTELRQKAIKNLKEKEVGIWSASVAEIISLDENTAQDIIFILNADAEILRQAINKAEQDETHKQSDISMLVKKAKEVEDRLGVVKICRELIGEQAWHLY